MTGERFARSVVISGFARSDVGRRLNRESLDLTIDACLDAVADAGLTPGDIDGLVTWPGELTGAMTGFGNPGVNAVQDALSLNLEWYATGASEGFNVLGSFIDGCMAVATGLARHVLVYRTVTEATYQGRRRRAASVGGDRERSGSWTQWLAPYGAASAANWAALQAQRHFHVYGTTEQQLGAIAVQMRRHAALNPDAIYRDPMSLDDYLAARVISTPLRLFDCDVPADGAHAFVLSHADYAPDAPHPVRVDAVAASRHGTGSWVFRDDMTTMAAHDTAARLWHETDLRPQNVDLVQLYDGFSIFPLLWLEALGFCEPGESGAFVEGGQRIAIDGDLPMNTAGGQLSEGRYLGWGLLHEACVQLRREAGGRQVADANVALVAGGGGNVAQSLLLTRHG
ncbi:thiolase family protein [Streptomyces sp. NPDC005811]|uniref:thiolase family protein n=1 Tax=Streptomyces sp. NPDC005811 TaxID=3154565 RepID=UPI0033E849A7